MGTGLAVWAPKKEGYSMHLTFREKFLVDGSTLSRSVLESMKTSGTVPVSKENGLQSKPKKGKDQD